MGRAFEYRREAKEKRWGKMSRIFPKLSKQITFAAKSGGPDPDLNPMLRVAIQNAKAENMPKDNIESAIKRAVDKEQGELSEIVYEGMGPGGVAYMVETTTDNPNRTVANLRLYFSKCGGQLGQSGSTGFLFTRRGVFTLPREQTTALDPEELELELIDHGLEELIEHEDEIVLLTEFENFGAMQKALEDKGLAVTSSKLERFALSMAAPDEEARANNEKLWEKLQEDDDVQNYFHNQPEED